MNNGLPPSNPEYEQLILGAILLDNQSLIDELDVTDFHLEKHRLIFSRLVNMNEKFIPIDLVTVRNELEQMGHLENAGGVMYLTYLTETYLPGLKIDHYVGEIKKASLLRRKWEDCHRAIRAIEEGKDIESVNDLLLNIGNSELTYNGNSLRPVSAKELYNLPPPKINLGRNDL